LKENWFPINIKKKKKKKIRRPKLEKNKGGGVMGPTGESELRGLEMIVKSPKSLEGQQNRDRLSNSFETGKGTWGK